MELRPANIYERLVCQSGTRICGLAGSNLSQPCQGGAVDLNRLDTALFDRPDNKKGREKIPALHAETLVSR
jgi:hypothetical protein